MADSTFTHSQTFYTKISAWGAAGHHHQKRVGKVSFKDEKKKFPLRKHQAAGLKTKDSGLGTWGGLASTPYKLWSMQ